MAYLFVHFREKTSPDGERVYFGISMDGFSWEEVNCGQPVLWAYRKVLYICDGSEPVIWNEEPVPSFVG